MESGAMAPPSGETSNDTACGCFIHFTVLSDAWEPDPRLGSSEHKVDGAGSQALATVQTTASKGGELESGNRAKEMNSF